MKIASTYFTARIPYFSQEKNASRTTKKTKFYHTIFKRLNMTRYNKIFEKSEFPMSENEQPGQQRPIWTAKAKGY